MSFRADLEIDGKQYRLLHCSYALKREVDETGRPSSEVQGGTINFEIESTEDTSMWDLMIAQFKSADGTITFKKRDEDAKMRELKFETAYVTDYAEEFDATSDDTPEPAVEGFERVAAFRLALLVEIGHDERFEEGLETVLDGIASRYFPAD